MTGTQAPNDGGHLGMSSQQDQMELELGENNRDGEGYSDSLYGADSQENGFVHGQARYASSTAEDRDLVTEGNLQTIQKLQRDLSNMSLAYQSDDAVCCVSERWLGRALTTSHTHNLSQELSQYPGAADDTIDTSDTDSEATIKALTPDDDTSMCPSPTLSSDSAIGSSSATKTNSEAAAAIDLEQYRRRKYRFISQVQAATVEAAGPPIQRTGNGRVAWSPDNRYNYIGVEQPAILGAGRRNRPTRPRSRSLDDYFDSISEQLRREREEAEPEAEQVYPPITRITNNNFNALPNIDFEILRPVEGTPDEVAEDITAAVLGRPEPHKFTLCRCDYHDRSHVFVHTYPDIDVFDWNKEDDILDLNLFRAEIIAKTFNISFRQPPMQTMHHAAEIQEMYDAFEHEDMDEVMNE